MDEELKINLMTIAHGIGETNKQLEKLKDTPSAMLVDTLYKVQKMIGDYLILKETSKEWQKLLDEIEEQINNIKPLRN